MNPDFVKVNGNVTFTPLLKDGDVVQYAGPHGPESLVLAPIECRISDGIIMHRGQEGVYLVAGGEGVQPDVIQWKATFSNMQAGGWAFTLKPVMFDAVPGGEVDLTLVSPIAGASEPIVRGPAGVGLKSITVEGSELVVTVTSEAGTYVLSRIPLEDVVRAEADQAVASVRASLQADVDAAVGSAAAAKESQEAAEKAASDAQNAAAETVTAAQAAIKADVDAAAKSATDAQTAASKTVESAQAAIRADVESAAGSAASAKASSATAATQAETATMQAGTATEKANAASTSAANAKTSETNAKTSETNAGKSATTATNEANRAKTEADRAAQKATEVANTVEGNYSPVGHHHVWADIDDKPATFPPSEHTHTWEQVKSKPATFPPDAHTHTVSQITNLDNGFAGVSISPSVSGNSVVKRDGSGNVVVPATPGYDTSAASKAYVDAQDVKIAALGSGVDLNTVTATGAYHQSLTANAQNGKNYPIGQAGLLEVFNPDSSMTYQRYTVYGNYNKVFTRCLYNSAWSKWEELSTAGHTHAIGDVSGLDNTLAGKTDKSYVDAQDAKQLTATEVEAKGASPAAGKVVRRDSAGQVLVPTTAGGSNTAVSRSELTSGLAGKANTSHTHTLSQISDAPNSHTSSNTANTLMSRDSAGRARVSNPYNSLDVANKAYVDAQVAGVPKIQVVSSLPSSPDSSTVYIVV
ncbi:TPA: hypothetical protein I8V59_001607 [Corynebacterium striatum]|nr:hypothetical protein [Corynebacterium striatum]